MLKVKIISGGSSATRLEENINKFFETFDEKFISLSYAIGNNAKQVIIVYKTWG